MSPDEDDEHLVERARHGDRDAFLTLYNRYLKRVYNRVKSRVPSAADAEDVTQEIFVAVVRSLPRFEQRSLFSTWLYTIVNRQIADFYRRMYRGGGNRTISLDEDESLELHAPDQDSDENVILQQALGKLPDNYQEIILMRFADGLSFVEIAQKNGKSLEATKSLYRRAIQAMVDSVEKET